MKQMSDNKVMSQARACVEIVTTLLWSVMKEKRPADRVLAGLLRGRREFGSRDRRLISETVFSSLRWWGWIHRYVPADFTQAVERGDETAPKVIKAKWDAFMIAAVMMEYYGAPPVIWAFTKSLKLQPAKFHRFKEIKSPIKRIEALDVLLSPGDKKHVFRHEDLAPEWVKDELKCPYDYTEMIEMLQQRPPMWLRVQNATPEEVIQELKREELDPSQHEEIENALCLINPRVNLYTLKPYKEGRIEVQDLASQLIGFICSPESGERWWDACAGAGGKSLLLAEMMNRTGSVTASDIREYKLDDLKKRARRSGFPNIRTRPWDGKAFGDKRAQFDGVLVDAPCTCSGTWRRNPDARWSTTREDIAEAAAMQLEILENACGAVKPGGVLVYATCSMFKAENQDVVNAFLKKHPEFKLQRFKHPIGGKRTRGYTQIWPQQGNCDAMFAARMEKIPK